MSKYIETLAAGVAHALGDKFEVSQHVAGAGIEDLVIEHLPSRTEVPAGKHTAAYTRRTDVTLCNVPGDKRRRATMQDVAVVVNWARGRFRQQTGPNYVDWCREAAAQALADFPDE